MNGRRKRLKCVGKETWNVPVNEGKQSRQKEKDLGGNTGAETHVVGGSRLHKGPEAGVGQVLCVQGECD